MFFSYLEAVVMKNWLPLMIGLLGSCPWWIRALLSSRLQTKIDNLFNPTALRILAFICIASAFIIANYSAWKDEHQEFLKKSSELTIEQDKNTIKLDGEFLQIFSSLSENKSDVDVLFTISLWNKGADSAIRGYRGKVRIEKQYFDLIAFTIPENGIILRDQEGTLLRKYFPRDAMYEKTLIPLKKGEIITGILYFKIKDVGILINNKDIDWTLFFNDYLGKTHEIHSPKDLHPVSFMYFPGVGGEVPNN